MRIMIVNISQFEAILEREKTRQSELPEHTLDWYTYSNRISLLEEVATLFEEPPKSLPKTKLEHKPEPKVTLDETK